MTLAVLAAGHEGVRATTGFNVVSATAGSATSVSVTFDAPPDATQATTLGNYFVSGLTLSGTPVLNNATVTLTTAAQTPSTVYTITVVNVTRASDAEPLTNNQASWGNAAPVLDSSKSPTMVAVLEDSNSQPIGAVGTPVSSLVDLDSVVGGLDNVNDPDQNAVTGVALIGTDPSLACWYTFNGGGSWSPLTSLSAANAMLLPADLGRVTCNPPADFVGTFPAAITFRAWDQSSGSPGTTVAVNTTGGTTAFSNTTDVASLSVTNVNDAPVLDSAKTPTLPTVVEDAPAPTGAVGALVSDLVDLASVGGGLDNVSDIDPGAVTGIAVTGIDNTFTCYYSLDGGTVWTPFGTVSFDTARLLAADADNRIYCRGTADVAGSALEPLFYAAWDQTLGTDGGTRDASNRGGTTPFSNTIDGIELNITPVDDPMSATNLSAPETYYSGYPLDLVDIGITEVDGDPMIATLTLSDPAAGSFSTETWGSTTSTYDAGTGVWTLSGAPWYEIEAQLAHVVFTPAAGYASDFTIATHVEDLSQQFDGTKAVTHGIPVVPVVTVTDAAVAEGNSGTKSLSFTVSLSEPTQVPVSVHFATANRTATAGSDYTGRSTTVSFAPGETSKHVTVTVRGDTLVELAETFVVKLASPNGVTIGDGTGVGTIRNDDRGLRVLAPNGGEKWARGTRHRISWLWGRLSGRVTIQLLRSGKVVKTITRTASLGTAGQGHLSWRVPATSVLGTGYKIRVISNARPTFKDSSSSAFRITRG